MGCDYVKRPHKVTSCLHTENIEGMGERQGGNTDSHRNEDCRIEH